MEMVGLVEPLAEKAIHQGAGLYTAESVFSGAIEKERMLNYSSLSTAQKSLEFSGYGFRLFLEATVALRNWFLANSSEFPVKKMRFFLIDGK